MRENRPHRLVRLPAAVVACVLSLGTGASMALGSDDGTGTSCPGGRVAVPEHAGHPGACQRGTVTPRRGQVRYRLVGRRLATSVAALLAMLTLSGVSAAAPAGPAPAESFTLAVMPPGRAIVGEAAVLRVFGTIPVRSLRFAYFVKMSWIPLHVVGECPSEAWTADQIARSTGGGVIVLSDHASPDGNGAFTVPVGITPYAAGRIRLCTYIYDGEATTLAVAQLLLDIEPADRPAAPVRIGAPTVERAGPVLTCSTGSWSNRPTRYTFGWLVDGQRIGGAGQTLRIDRRLRGRLVSCRVVASNGAGATVSISRPLAMP